jgi:4'-phosphopantetheinyl transferase
VAARGQLRAILAEYLQLGADAVRFEYNEYGKPSLRRSGVTSPICFNLTHSDGLAALAVASDRAVGVDIERIRTVAEDMTNWIMTDAEKRRFRSLAPELRRGAFFRCWTRKEAVLKAIGHGFSLSPRSLEVSFGINEHSRLRRIGGDRLSTQVWRVADFTPAPGYAGAIAAQEPPWTLRLRQAPLIAESGDETEQNPLGLVCLP